MALEANDNSMDVDEPQVKLKTSDGMKFTVTKTEASCSNTLKTMFESISKSNNCNAECINLSTVSSKMLTQVLDWCRKHCGDPCTDANNAGQDLDNEISDWDKQFLARLTELEMFELMHVSNYLDVRTLFEACCRVVAKKWEGKRVEEIRKMYDIQSDFTQDEEHLMLIESKKLGMDN